MALVAEKGVITSPTTTGNFTTNLGSAFNGILPKVLMLWTTDQTAVDTFGTPLKFSLGFATYDGSAVQQCFVSASAFPTDPSNAVRAKNTTACLKPFDADSTTADAEYDLVSLNSGTPSNFILNVANAPANAIKIHYLVLGGDDITAARCGSFNANTGAGTQNVTVNSGFGTPKLIWFIGPGFANTDGAQGNIFMDIGVGSSDSLRQSAGVTIGEGAAALISIWQDARIVTETGTGGTEDVEADLSAVASWPTDGFQVNWTNPPGAANGVLYCALAGDFQVAMGSNSALTSGADQDNACGFAPIAAGVFGVNDDDATTAPVASGTGCGAFMFGATDGTNEGCVSISVDDALTSNARYDSRSTESKTLLYVTPETPTVESEADGSFSGNNFRLSYSNLDTVARDYNWWAVGEAAGAVEETPTPGGAVAGGVAPAPKASVTIGGADAAGVTVVPRASVTIGGALAGGQLTDPGGGVTETPTPGGAIAAGNAPAPSTALTVAGATAAGTAPSVAVSAAQGGAVAAGAAPSPQTAVAQGGAQAAGQPATARVSTIIGGALAAGQLTDPLAGGTSETPTPGGAIAGGTAPTAAATFTIGGALVGGASPTVRVDLIPGGAIAGGQLADPLAAVVVILHFAQPSPGGGVRAGVPTGGALNGSPDGGVTIGSPAAAMFQTPSPEQEP